MLRVTLLPPIASRCPGRILSTNTSSAGWSADGIQPATISDHQEFLRRLFLDPPAGSPSVEQVRAFAYDANPGKRDMIVDALVGNVEYINKWTMFLGDLYKNNSNATNVVRYFQGRDAFYTYLKDALTRNKPYNQIVWELITANGDNWVNGAANWVVGGTVPMGPAQDTYDGQAVNTAQMFLGINAADCLRPLMARTIWTV